MTIDTLEICFQANMTGVTSQLNALVAQLSTLPQHASSAGNNITLAMAEGMSASMATVFSAGAALSQGLANGILSKKSSVVSAARIVSNAAANAMKTTLSIHSPSKVSRALGEDFSRGFSIGIGESMEDVRRHAVGLSTNAVTGLSAARLPEITSDSNIRGTQTTGQDVNLTIPINVDGMRLGEASIRGINAVTRATGKLLLDI